MNRIMMGLAAAGAVLALASAAPAFAEASDSAKATPDKSAGKPAAPTGSAQAKTPAQPRPGELGKLTLQDEPLKALGGRVLIRMPAAAKIEPREEPAILAAGPTPPEETRIILDAGRERMILIATETFTTADSGFGEAVARLFPDGSAQPMAKDAAEPRSYLVVPKEPKPGATATLAAMALLVLPDKTVVEVDAYVNAEARKDLAGMHAAGRGHPDERGGRQGAAGMQGRGAGGAAGIRADAPGEDRRPTGP